MFIPFLFVPDSNSWYECGLGVGFSFLCFQQQVLLRRQLLMLVLPLVLEFQPLLQQLVLLLVPAQQLVLVRRLPS
jgi:hypothetical protein